MTLTQKVAIAGAAVGLAAIACVLIFDVQSTRLLFTLWPTSIVGFGYNGGQPLLGFVIGLFEIVGNAAIYGLVGMTIGYGIELVRKRTA